MRKIIYCLFVGISTLFSQKIQDNSVVKSIQDEKLSIKKAKQEEAFFIMEKLIDASNLMEEYFIILKTDMPPLSVLSKFSKQSLALSKDLKDHGVAGKGVEKNLLLFSDLFACTMDKVSELILQFQIRDRTRALGQYTSTYQNQKLEELKEKIGSDLIKCMHFLCNSSCQLCIENCPFLSAEQKSLLCSRIHSKGASIAAECYEKMDNGADVASALFHLNGKYQPSMSIYGMLKDRKDIIAPQ